MKLHYIVCLFLIFATTFVMAQEFKFNRGVISPGRVPQPWGKWSNYVAITRRDHVNTEEGVPWCNGFFINKTHVITAGHCLFTEKLHYLGRPGCLKVIANTQSLNPMDPSGIIINVKRAFVYKDYDRLQPYIGDLGILELEEHSHKRIFEEKDYRHLFEEGTSCCCYGFSIQTKTGQFNNKQLHLRKSEYRNITNAEECRNHIEKKTGVSIEKWSDDNPKYYCLKPKPDESNVCFGDWSAVFLCVKEEPNGKPYLASGVPVFAQDCNDRNDPVVINALHYFKEFIEEPAKYSKKTGEIFSQGACNFEKLSLVMIVVSQLYLAIQ